MKLNQQFFIFITIGLGLFLVIGLVAYLAANSRQVQESYAEFIAPPAPPRQLEGGSSQLVIRKIRVETEGECGSVEIERNGTSTLIDCGDTTRINSVLLSNDKISKIFENLTSDEFIELEAVYYAPELEKTITITLETNFGTRTITISNSDSSAPTLESNESLEEIVEEIEETEEELEEPLPTPPPTLPPSPSPSPGYSPSPQPSPSVTPTPTTTPNASPDPQATAEPFRCDMLESQGVTVSNIRCVE